MLNATKTYVDAYVTLTCMKRINLHAKLPARQDTVTRQMMSVKTFNKPTHKSESNMPSLRNQQMYDICLNVYYFKLGSMMIILYCITFNKVNTCNGQLLDEKVHARFLVVAQVECHENGRVTKHNDSKQDPQDCKLLSLQKE